MLRASSCAVLALVFCRAVEGADNWPQFRGPDGQGHAPSARVPLAVNESSHVTWKTPIPGQGWSSPVAFDRQVWMTTATEAGKSLRALCVDLQSGELLQNLEVFRVPQPESINLKNSYASPTPIIEAGRVYVYFGTNGIACLDTGSGRILWNNRDLKLDHKEGPGSSPILYEELVIFHCDGMDVQYIVALDKHTGKIAWKNERSGKPHDNPDFRKAYSTPLVIRVGNRDVLVSTAAHQVLGYDPRTGEERWKVRYTGFSNVSRPVTAFGLVYVVTDFARPQMLAIKPDGRGDVTDTNVAWRAPKQICSASSPLIVGDGIYMVTNRGVATCIDAQTGEIRWTERLGGNYSASPVEVNGRIYICSEEGKVYTLAPAGEYKLLASGELNGRLMASPAVADGALLIRSDTHLYRIEERP
jgi:outer membrane protein assembly factor BamB